MGRTRTLPDPEPRACRQCGGVFTPLRKKWRQVYCTVKCQRDYALNILDNAELARATAKQRGDTLRGRGEGKTRYRKREGKHEHRLFAERQLGRPLEKGETVHHKDGNSLRNDDDNLVVLASQSEHARLHAEERRRKKVMPNA